jgi:hypothetical protein
MSYYYNILYKFITNSYSYIAIVCKSVILTEENIIVKYYKIKL